MTGIPFIPDTAPFTQEQRAWLNGFLAGLFTPSTPGASPPSAPAGQPPPAGEPLTILFGSQTGTAEALARRVAEEAARRGFAPQVLALNDHAQANLPAGGKAVMITSTWGDGDPPDNAVRFWSWLTAADAPRLDHLHYAVLGLGDRNYADFCGAARKFDARLEALGACRLVSRGECDGDPEIAAGRWLAGLWDKLPALSPPNGKAARTFDASSGSAAASPESVFGRARPFPARLLRNVLLNQPGSAKEVRHYELSLEGSGLTYEAGDALGVVPVNCPALVDGLLRALRCEGTEAIPVGDNSRPLREALARHYDITKPSPELLALVAARSPSRDLANLLAPDRREDLQGWLRGRDVLDLIELCPEPPALEELTSLLRKLAPRLYSIASSPRAHPGEVHLTVSTLRYECHGRARRGVASTFLADRVGEKEVVHVFVQPSAGFRPPACGETPVIMVGPGTGIAPFRAFLEDRQAAGARGRNWLFFGDQTRAGDFLYEDQLTGWVQTGHLTRLDLAFSRDQAAKWYVQDRMLDHAAELWSWLEEGAHFYVCGDASRMARDVDAALHKVIEQAGGRSAEQAKEYVEKLKAARRYARDVY